MVVVPVSVSVLVEIVSRVKGSSFSIREMSLLGGSFWRTCHLAQASASELPMEGLSRFPVCDLTCRKVVVELCASRRCIARRAESR